MSKEMDTSLCFGLGLLAGVVGGIVAGVLLAPRSGDDTRADLVDKVSRIKENFPEKIERAKRKSIRSIEETKASIENIIEDIQDSLKAQKLASAKEKEAKSFDY